MPVFVRNLFVGLAFVPLVCLVLLLAAVRYPWMDGVSAHTPMGLRTALATVVLNRAEYGEKSLPALERVVRLDPGNTVVRERMCRMSALPPERRMEECRKAIALNPTPWNYMGLADLQEERKDWVGAEATMRIAQSKADTIDDEPATFLRELGRLEMANGELDKSLADLTQAEKFDSRDAEFAKNDDGEAADNVEMDREYLVVLFNRMHDAKRAEAMCRKALPKETRPCGCELDEKNLLHCAVWPPIGKDDAKP